MSKLWQQRNLIRVLLGAVIFGAGLIIGFWLSSNSDSVSNSDLKILRAPVSSYAFIKPLVGFDFSNQQNFPELDNLRDKIDKYIKDQLILQRNLSVSVYYRYLDNGHWIGIDEDKMFNPGSLLKVPIMIAYFKKAESAPGILRNRIFYDGSLFNGAELPNSLKSVLVKDTEYSVEDLMEAMIVSSDNVAKDLLISNISPSYLYEVFSDIGIPLPDSESYGISAKLYASFFRRLYNATFLERDSSEAALGLLSQAKFDDGLVAGIPKGIKAAHKYGERGVYADDRLVGVELHDCGIIYYPGHPYLLCIMTKSRNANISSQIIQDISKIIYEAMPAISG